MTAHRPAILSGALAAITLALGPCAAGATGPSFAGYGFRGGIAAARLHGDYGDVGGPNRRLGGSATWLARFRLDPWFSVQAELGWVSKGGNGQWSFPVTSGTAIMDIEHRFEYLEFPALLRLDVPTGRAVQPFLLGGPGLAIRLDSQRTTHLRTIGAVPNAAIRHATIFEGLSVSNPKFKAADWSAIGGGGLLLGRGRLRMVLDGRYELGLRNVSPESAASACNGAWVASIGVEVR